MDILKLTKDQHDSIQKLIDIGVKEGLEEIKVKEKILETHIKKGWEGTSVTECLNKLSVSEMSKALFNGEYEIIRNVKFQEYTVEFQLNKHTSIKNTVTKYNSNELSKDEVIELAIQNINRLNMELSDVNSEMFSDYKEIKKEFE